MTGGLTLLVIGLAMLNWDIAPERSNAWIAAMVTMPVIWVIAGLKMKLAPRVRVNEVENRFFNAAVILAGLLLVFSLAARFLGKTYGLDPSLIERARNVFTGFILLYFANMLPKLIGPALKGKCSSAAAHSVRRFAGWALALGAIGYIGAWLFAPISQTSNIAHGCVGTAVILVALRVSFALIKERQPST